MPSTRPPASPALTRILHRARARFFQHGYSAFNLDELAAELGMSKKTLYVHFHGKAGIIRAVIEELGREIRADADTLLASRRLGFAGKLHGFAAGMGTRLARLNPQFLGDLQRSAPDLYRRMAEVREKNIPYVFGRFITEGQRTGMVRRDVSVPFAVEFFLQAIHGLIQPPTLERLQLAPHQLLPRAIELFFGGLLTPAGRKAHEKLSFR